MDNLQLVALIEQNLPHHCVNQFLGCLTADELLTLKITPKHPNPLYIIVNVLPSSHKKLIGHWVLIHIHNKTVIFFDSFGLEPSLYSHYFRGFLNNHSEYSLWYQNKKLQAESSYVCGAYVLYFIHVICHRGLPFLKKELKRFRFSSSSKNDRVILREVYKKYDSMPSCVKTFCLENINYKECVFYLCKGI